MLEPKIWPIAFAEKDKVEPLDDHLVRTAVILVELFERELKYLESQYEPIYKVAILASLFHDLGKANEYSYRQYEKGKGKISFKCHEVLSFLILEKMRYNRVNKSLGLGKSEWDVVQYAVLNHHHAMRLISECAENSRMMNAYKAKGLASLKIWKLLGLEPPKDENYLVLEGWHPGQLVMEFSYKIAKADEHNALTRLKYGFVVSGLLSLADTLAAFLYRGEMRDTAQTPSRYVRLTLEERGYTVEEFKERYAYLVRDFDLKREFEKLKPYLRG